MLKVLRDRKTAKKIWITLAVLIIPAFVMWGSASMIGDKDEQKYVGKIFGKKISRIDYEASKSAVKNMAIVKYGQNLSEIQKYINIDAQAWDRLILLAEAKKRKINAADNEVVDFIGKYEFFQKDGVFNNAIYTDALTYAFNIQPRAFEEQIRQNIIISKLFEAITAGVKLNEEELKEEYRKLNEEVSINYICCLSADYSQTSQPEDGLVRDFFEKNKLQFKQPVSFNIEYTVMPYDPAKEKDARQKIKTIYEQLAKKEELKTVVQVQTLEYQETGFFPENEPIPGLGWEPQVTEMISKAKTGTILKPVLIENKIYIMRIKEKKDSYIPDFESVKPQVAQAFAKYQSHRSASEKINQALSKLNEIKGTGRINEQFDLVSKELGVKTGTTALFKFGSYIEGLGSSDPFFTQASLLGENDYSGIIENQSGFYIIRLNQKVPIDEKKFEKEKENFKAMALAQIKGKNFAEFMDKLKENAMK